ncbi:MAG: cobalt ECF transporter T component CbiQ [Phycisphaerae bacterium]|nr:cobalt ECF transporter T component CbiQ [Phycisphaerae bacterium]
MIIFEATNGSLIHRIDPRVRVAAACAFAAVVCLSHRLVALEIALAAALGLVVLGRLSIVSILGRIKALNLFILVIVLLLPLFIPGEPAIRISGLTWTREGLHRAGLIALRANIIMLAMICLLATMEPAHLGFALRKLGVPEKLTHVLLFMIRYVELFHQEYHRLRDALRLRAFRPACNRHTFRTFGYIVGLLLVRSMDRAQRVLDAMKCRGFHGRLYVLAPFRFTPADAAFALLAAGLVILLSWIQLR